MNAIIRPAPIPTAQVAPYVDALGLELAVEFLLFFGGADLELGKSPSERSQIVALIGREKALALAEGSWRLQRRVPLAKRWLTAVLHWQGHSNAGIARRLRISDVTVRNYLKSGRLA